MMNQRIFHMSCRGVKYLRRVWSENVD